MPTTTALTADCTVIAKAEGLWQSMPMAADEVMPWIAAALRATR